MNGSASFSLGIMAACNPTTVSMASDAPMSAWITPSSRNGVRMNQLLAPTRRMMPISLRRA